MKERIEIFIEDCREEMLSDIAQLIKFQSIEGNDDQIYGALEFVLDRAREMGFEVNETTTGDVGVIDLGTGKETLGILTHVDVVGIGDIEKWEHNPFDAKIGGGFIAGRGSVDDKGPVIMSLYAMKAVRELRGIPVRKVRLIVGTREESEWTDMENYRKEFDLPDYGFSPDGEFPIFNIEKGYCDVKLTFKGREYKDIIKLEAGDSPNTIPSKAEITFADGEELVFNGVSVHSSDPQQGINAIELLSEGYRIRHMGFARFVRDFFSDDGMGEGLEIDDGTDSCNGVKVGKTVASPTILKKSGDKIILNINLRHKFGVRREDVEEAFAREGGAYGFELEIVDFGSPMMTDCRQEPFVIMQETMKAYGYEPEIKIASGASYASSMPNMVSWGPVFEKESAEHGAHVENERLSIETMMTATKMYAYYLEKMLWKE